MQWQLDELKRRYENLTGQTLSYRDIAVGSKISVSTVSKILNRQSQAADFEVAEKLLSYFSDKFGYRLNLTDILSYEPGEEAQKM